MSETITFKKRRSAYVRDGKTVGVSKEVYTRIKELADSTGLTMSEIATDLLNDALDRVELID